MAWNAVLTTLDGRVVQELEYLSAQLQPALNGYAEAKVRVAVKRAAKVAIASRALKLYDDDGALRFNGQVWEPLDATAIEIAVTARDPYATFLWRRVLDNGSSPAASYPATDAGAIMKARVDAQNARRTTYLRALNANIQASKNRDRFYYAGKLESEIFDELAGAADAPFFRVHPVDGVPNVMGDLFVRYPDAGTTRPEVRFEYGADTVDNVLSYTLTRRLPLNRSVAATATAATPPIRLASAAQDAASIAENGLFEDEQAYADVTDTALLQAQAAGQLAPKPPRTIVLEPGPKAPLITVDFDVGDLVRVLVRSDTPLAAVNEWARVVNGVLTIDGNGDARTTQLEVELLDGAGSIQQRPERIFRERFDDLRRRLEALEHRNANPAPAPDWAAMSAAPLSGDAPLTVAFADTSAIPAPYAFTSRLWDFGDGTTSTAANPTHAFAPGASTTYTVTLTVVATFGGTVIQASTQQTIDVNVAAVEPPPPAPPAPPSIVSLDPHSSWWATVGQPAPRAPQLELHGQVNPNGSETDVWFEYREGVDFSAVAPGVPIQATPKWTTSYPGVVTLNREVKGVTPGTTYYVRLRAASAAGEVVSGSLTTTTPQVPIRVVQ